MAINKNKVQLQETVLDSNGHPLSSTDVNPLTSSDCVIMENGMTLEDVMGNDTVIDTPTIMNEDTSFKVGIGDSETKVIDSDVAKMVIEGKTYQNILPRPTTLIMNTDEKEFKINDKIDGSIVLDDNVAEIATIKGQTYVNVVQEESASEYVTIDEELNGQSITTTGKPEGYVKNATLEGLTLVNVIQEPSGADATVLDLDADINAQSATIDNTVQGGIKSAILSGQTLVNIHPINYTVGGSGDIFFTLGDIPTTMIKPNTRYFLRLYNTHQSIVSAYFRPCVNNTVNLISSDNKCAIFTTKSEFTADDFMNNKIHFYSSSELTLEDVKDTKVVLCEYQDGMENWDIPYFEGMQSVKMPVLTTTGKNLFDENNVTVNANFVEVDNIKNAMKSSNINFYISRDEYWIGTFEYNNGILMMSPTSPYKGAWIMIGNLKPNSKATISYTFNSEGSIGGASNSTATVDNDGYCKFVIENREAVEYSISKIQIEYGESSSAYEPFKSSVFTISETNLIIDSEKGRYYHYKSGYIATDEGSRYDSYRANVEGLMSVYVKNTHSNYTFWDANMNFISGVPYVNGLISDGSHNKDGVVNVPSNAKYMRFAYDTVENNGLPCVSEAVTLRKVGDVQDELDLETGKLTQRIGEVVFDGSEDEDWRLWENHTFENTVCFVYRTTDMTDLYGQLPKILCNKLLYIEGAYQKDVEGIASYRDDNYGNKDIFIRINSSRLETADLSGFKKWLKENPIIAHYPMEDVVKTVDLTIHDQDNNSVKTIQTHPTLTHVSTSSNGLIPFVTIPSQLKYPTIIKPSTTYTVQLKQTTVNSEFPLTINLGGTVMAVPSTKFTITTPETLTSQDVIFTGKNNVIGEVVITEGDTTGIEYNYFEGMNDVKSPKMIAVGKNLFDYSSHPITLEKLAYTDGQQVYWTGYIGVKTYVPVKENTTYTYSNDINVGIHFGLVFYDGDKSVLSYINIFETNNSFTSFTTPKGCKFIRFAMETQTIPQWIQLEESSTATSYEPYKGVTIEQDIDSIPLTSDMFEQGGINAGDATVINGMSYQQFPQTTTNTNRVKSKTIIPVKPNAKYKINLQGYAIMFDKNGGYVKIGSQPTLDFTSGVEFTIPSNVHYMALCLKNSDNSNITPSSLDSLNLTLQEVTDEIVLRSIGDVKDTLNLTTGEYVQRIGELVLDGSENWGYSGDHVSNEEYAVYNTTEKIKYGISSSRIGIADKLEYSVEAISTNLFSKECVFINNNYQVCYIRIKRSKITNTTIKEYLSQNPLTVQYHLETPIIKKVNLTNTTKLPSYASTTHYDTIVPSNSLVPNIKIPSTIDYNVAIKPSTQYTIRANTTSAMSVNLGGSTGTLANGKVTLTTPSTLAHNSLKLGNGKAKEVMVIEGSEIKDNVPFFNGMKNVQMGGIKLVNVARFKNKLAHTTTNTNKTQFTYTSVGSDWGRIIFDGTLLKPNTKYTIYMNVITITSDNSLPIKIECGNDKKGYIDVTQTGVFKKAITTVSEEEGFNRDMFRIAFRPCTSGQQVVIQNPMVIEGDWTHLDEIPYIESEMIIEQPIIRSQGKNLFDIKEDATEWGGATIKSNSDNTITYTPNSNNSAALEAGFYFKQPVKVKTGTKYTYSMKRISGGNADFSGSINNQILVRKKDGTITSILGMSDFNTNTFNQTLTAIYSFDDTVESIVGVSPIMYGVRNLTSPIVMQYQIEEGSSATTYEPFKQHTLSSNRVIGYEEGCYYGYGTGNKITQTGQCTMLADVEGLSIAYVTDGGSNYSFWDKDMVFISGKGQLDTALEANNKNGFIQVPSNAKYMRFASSINGSTDYTKATVTGELPLRSLPNGVCDSFNLVTGEYVQRIKEVTFDGTETWGLSGGNYGNCLGFIIRYTDIVNAGSGNINFNVLNGLTGTNMTHMEVYHYDRTAIRVLIGKEYLKTQDADGFKQYLSQNPITVQYELETPIVRKIGLTAKGNYREQVLDGSEEWAMDAIDNNKTVRMTKKTTSPLQNPLYDTVLFTDDYHVRALGENHGTYEYITCIGNGIYINIYQTKVSELSVQGCTQWLSQNPIKVGYLTTNSASLYSNIQKPIFFKNVKVQFMNDNVDIQPSLTLQARSRNSYVIDMMKPNTLYTSKFLQSANGSTFIDGTVVSMKINNVFTSPSTLTNKLMITPLNRQELMIIEGDVTGKQLPYYKGIRSAYDDVNKVEVLSQNKNLFDINAPFTKDGVWSTVIEGNSIISTRINDNVNGAFGAGFRINHIKPNTIYTLSWSSAQGYIYIYNNSGLWGSNLSAKNTNEGNSMTFTTKPDTKYITIGFNYGQHDIGTVLTTTDIKLEEGSVATPYQPHKENTTIINMPMQLETVEVVRPNMEMGAIDNTNGQECTSTNGTEKRLPFTPVLPKEILTFRNGTSYRAMNVHLYDINKNFIKYQYTNGTGDLVVPESCYFIRGFCRMTDTHDLTITKQQYKPIALNELPNGVKDELIINRATSSANLIRRVGKVVLDGSEDWALRNSGTKYSYTVVNLFDGNNCQGICDKFTFISGGSNNSQSTESICSAPTTNALSFFTNNDNLSNINSLKLYLQQNPITVYYELAEPVITEIRLKGYPFIYEDGNITLNTDIAPVTRTSYNVNQHQLINSQNETIIRHDKQISDLYDYIEIYLDEIYRMELFKMQLELSL